MWTVPEDKCSCTAVAEHLGRSEGDFPHRHLSAVSFWGRQEDVMNQKWAKLTAAVRDRRKSNTSTQLLPATDLSPLVPSVLASEEALLGEPGLGGGSADAEWEPEWV